MKTGRGVLAAGLLLALADVRVAIAGQSCTAHCVARMAACRAERCPGATGTDRRACRDACRAVSGCAAGGPRLRTLATVVNECRASGGMWTFRQRLEIRRGDCPPVVVTTFEASEPTIDPLRVCELYGVARQGGSAMTVGVLQGLAVSRDGDTVVFQVTDDFLGRLVVGGFQIPSPPFKLATEGIFTVRADGTDLRRIADQSREPAFVVRSSSSPLALAGISIVTGNGFNFSPDGKTLVFVDRGPGSDGSDAPQIFTLDAVTGARRQLTTFAASSIGSNPATVFDLTGVFLDDRRIGGYVYDAVEGGRYFTVARDGRDLRFIEEPSPIEGATIVPDFGVVGGATTVYSAQFRGRTTVQPQPGLVREVFRRTGENTLQLTNYGRSDTFWPIRLRDRRHAVFRASANPVGGNPEEGSQLFRVDLFGGHVRQLTRFPSSAPVPVACTGASTAICATPVTIGILQDPVTGTLLLDSSCDPFGLGAVSQQLYALRPDGSGLRQLTDYRGLTCDDGTVNVELPGPIAYSAPAL